MDRQTTCDRNTALCTKVHRAVKTAKTVAELLCIKREMYKLCILLQVAANHAATFQTINIRAPELSYGGCSVRRSDHVTETASTVRVTGGARPFCCSCKGFVAIARWMQQVLCFKF